MGWLGCLMRHNVGIVGLGYLGLPIANRLQNLGMSVIASKGSLAEPSVIDTIKVVPLNLGVQPFRLPESSTGLFKVDTLICSIPPSGCPEYAEAVDWLVQQAMIHKVTKFILLSSISVYGESMRVCDENSVLEPITKSALAMVQAEKKLLQSNLDNVMVLRLGGLFSDDRHPVKHLAGKTNIKNGQHVVNLLHKEDAVLAICTAVSSSESGVWNICADDHPSRAEFYTKEAKRLGLTVPEFDLLDFNKGKMVSNAAFKEAFNFVFEQSLM